MADEFEAGHAPKVVPQQNPSVRAGKLVELDLSLYFEPQSEEILTYHLEKCPEGLSIDKNTGILKGMSPPDITNQSYVIDLVATSSLTGLTSHVIFDLKVMATDVIEENAEVKDLFDLDEINFDELGGGHETKFFLQYMLNNYFIYIQLQDGYYTGEGKGDLLNIRKAETGWSIYEYEHSIIISSADMMFAEGNRGRFLRTLREVYLREVPEKGWHSIFVLGNDPDNIGRAWVVAKEMNLPVTDVAPTYVAEVNLATIERMRQVLSR